MKKLNMCFLEKNNNNMDKIHRNSLAAALCAAFLFLMSFSSFGQNIIYSCDFEDDAENAGWTLVNDDQTNQWYIGSAASNGGSNGLYITNDGGATNEYTFDDVELTVYAYRTIEITENTICNVSFDWMSEGEFYYDYALAFIIPNGSDFSDFDNIWIDDYDSNSLYDVPSGWIYISNSIMNGVTSWQNSTRRIVLAQGTYNLVFFWKNNESDGENPPVAIDNISIIKEAPATLPYTCNFENATENEKWILANCDYYNGWYIGSGAYNGGSKGLYISNDQGTSNSADYDDTYVYAYREINTSETGEYVIDFDWRAYGENPYESSDAYTLLRSFIIPTSINPNLNECNDNGMSSYNNNTPSGWIDASSSENGLMYGQSSWQHSAKVLSIDAGTYYLVFFWKNNSDHIDPPAAVDNISISRVVNPAVATSSVSNLGATSATLNGEILNQGASDVIERGFMYGTSSGNLSNTLPSTDNTDAFSYDLTGLTENTTYYYRAYATNNNGTGYGAVKSFKTLNTLNGHIFVDLGLPSGLLWATCNVGASSPEDSGDYFAWGETTPKEMYSLENYKYSNSEDELLTKYCDNSQYGHDGFVDNLSILEASDDAATANWGSGWHMPSVSEFEELMDNCTLTWTTQNGASGYLFTGSNGNSIFLPAAGYRYDGGLLTGHGEYWARTNVATMPNYANYLGFYDDDPFTDYESRHFGYSVRPVLTASPTVETNSATDVESTSATLQGRIYFAENATVTNRGFAFGTDSENLTQNFTSNDNTDYFSYTVTGLTENTTYYFKAYATINGETKYGEVKSFRAGNPNNILQCGFEDAEDNANWTLNDNGTIKWQIGIDVNNSGENSLYVSDVVNSGTYYNSYVYAYREMQISESSWYQIEYDWLAKGGTDFDEMKAFLIPISLNPDLSVNVDNGMSDDNLNVPSGWIDISSPETMHNKLDWQHNSVSANVEAGTYYLVFFWRTYDHAGANPAAVDNVRIYKTSCPSIVNLTLADITDASVTLNWNNYESAGSWNVIVSESELTDEELNAYSSAVTVTDSTYTATGLSPTTNYNVYVRAVCSADNYSPWISKNFNTYQTPASLPYTCGFEDAEENANWALANGDQTNKWYIGTAANNGGENGLYISNDEGANNTYNNAAASYVYAYRDILINESGFYNISFDWRAEGLNYYNIYEFDLLRAFLVPNSLSPIIIGGDANGMFDLHTGLINVTPEGWIEVSESGEPLLNQSEWQSSSKDLTLDAGTYKLVFFWQNINKDEVGIEEGGSNPPAAIDNISISRISCPSISNILVNDISGNSATISWTERGSAEMWKLVVSATELNEAQLEEADAILIEDEPMYEAEGLNATTNYYLYVCAVCSADESSRWESKIFVTTNNSGTLFYYCDFEDEAENGNWELNSNGSRSDWVISTQSGNNEHNLKLKYNPSGSMMEERGYATRTIEIPEDSYYLFDFDWKADSQLAFNLATIMWIPDTCNLDSLNILEPERGINICDISFMYGITDWQHSTYRARVEAGNYKLAVIGSVAQTMSGTDKSYIEIDNIIIYKSAISEPIMATGNPTDATTSSVTLHGNITDNGGTDVTERGFVYGTDKQNLNNRITSNDENDDFSATITGLASGIYYYKAYATNSEGTGYGEIMTHEVGNGLHNGYSYIDLGLPSGLLWSTINVGANGIDENGDYFAWGETQPKEEYTEDTYTYSDSPTTLPAEADAATANWGEGWRLPTKDEIQELYDNSTMTFIRLKGLYPMVYFTGPNGNRIVLPMGGVKGQSDEALSAVIMSSELNADNPEYPLCLVIASIDGTTAFTAESGVGGVMSRYIGFNVRPVRSPELATSSPGYEIYNCDFEDDAEYANWTVNNGDETNHWATGIMSMTSGDKTLFITNGNDNEYNNEATSYAYATREIEIEQVGRYQFEFDWRCNGEEEYDVLRAFFIPSTANPNLTDGESNGMSDNNNDAPQVWIDISNGAMSEENDWKHCSKIISINDIGTYDLVFFWKNDYSAGNNPPAAVDNIVISKMPPVEVVTQNATRTSTTATLGGELSIEGEQTITQVGFEYGTQDNYLADTVEMAYGENTFTSQITELTPQTTYYYRAFAKYGDDKISYGELVTFRTKTNDTDGTEDNPLTIDNAEEWEQFAEAVGTAGGDTTNTYKDFEIFNHGEDTYFELTADIDLEDCNNVVVDKFRGYLIADEKTIAINNNEEAGYSSIFNTIENATIDGINIMVSEVIEVGDEQESYGPLCLIANSSTISNCTTSVASADVEISSGGGGNIGGFVGNSINSTIINCTNNLPVNMDGGSEERAGGIVGYIQGGSVEGCTNNATITGDYAGGIAGQIWSATLSTNLNAGNVIGDEKAGGIVAYAMNGDVVVDKCMNIGTISASGISAGIGYGNGLDVTNTANYGAFTDFARQTTAGFGAMSGSVSKNIVAPIYIGNTVREYVENNVYATIYVSEEYEGQITESDDFFDEQVSDIRVDSLRLKFAENGTAKETSQIVGSALQSTLSTNWTYTDGLYPMPAGIPENTKTTLARIPIYLSSGETAFGVRSNFTVPTTVLGQPVTWASDNAAISISNGTATVTRPAEGENDIDVNITADYGGYTKTFVVRVIAPKHIPVNTDDAVQDSVVTFYGSFDMATDGVTYAREYGFVYSTNSNLSDSIKVVSTNLSHSLSESRDFSASVNNLEESTMYYYRAFATTGDGTEYGEIKSIKTLGAPSVVAKYPMWRTDNTATIELDITLNEDEIFEDLESAFYYGTERDNLSLSNIISYDDDYHNYSVELSDLAANTKYYYVAEVSDDYGTTRSDTLEFMTYGTMTDDRDNTQYYTIQIGNQTWMAQNLKYAGNEVSFGEETSYTEPFYYYVNNDEANTETYGYLYNWSAAMNGASSSTANPSGVQGICPNGWHLPSDAEWTQLTDYLGGIINTGAMLAGQPVGQDQYWETSEMTQSVNFGKTGFNALPAGYYNGYFSDFGSNANLWSTTMSDGDVHNLGFSGTDLYIGGSVKYMGYSIRCVKGSTVYAYDTVPYCGAQYEYHDTIITASGDYIIRRQIEENTETIYNLHLTMYPELTATISNFSTGCYGEANGFVEVTAEGGAGSYTYRWDTPDEQTNTRLENLVAGEYVVNVTDAVGCSVTASKTLAEPDQLTLSINGTNPSCYGSATTLTSNPNGGTPAETSPYYTFAWSSGESTAEVTVTPTETTTYTLTVTDANSCTATAVKNVIVPTELTVSITGTTTLQCYGETTDLTADANGGSMAMGYNYAWSTNATGQNLTGVGAGTYNVTVTDGNGCNATSSVTVTGPDAALSISISATNTTLTCSNTSATITATVTGGTEDYTYNWSNSGTNNTSEVTTSGSYTVVVTDANGCSVEAAQTITEDKTAPTVTIDNNETELNCNRTSITLTATGSDASYVWSNGGTNAATTVTTPDTYTVTATGDNGCTNETSVTITKVENPTVDVTASEILCNGATTTFTANVSNGAAPYSYSWQDDLGSSQTLNAQAGTYSVTVMDSNSCTASASGTANQPEQLTASVTKTDDLCNGASNGTATVTVDGGTDPYTYVWSDNADRNSNTATGLTTGTYSIIVSDANGCSTTVETTIDQPSTLTASASAEAISCYGGTTTATVAVNGGTEQYTYVWSDNADRNSNTASDITAGTYSVTVTDANGCSADAATTITEPDELTVSLSATEILCNGGTTTVTAAPNGGTSPYAYAWQGNSSTESSLSGVAGTYSVTVTDNNGCSATESTTVSVNDQTAPELTGTWPSNITGQNNCFANADINELLSDDDIEALYEDCSGLTVSHNDANTSTDNCAWTITRTYTIQDTYGNAVTPSPTMSVSGSDQTGPTIGDDNLNRQLTSTNCTFTVPDLTSEVRSIANDNCTANDDLTITQNPTAGTEITTATTVTVTVTDQCGNSSTKEIELTLPNELTTSLSAGTIACNGGTAEVTNTVTGGTEPYQFAWNNNATTQNLTGVSGGTYSVTVTDANNCTASASATVNEPDQLTSTLSAGTISCYGGTADVTNTVTGGTEPYQFAWSNEATTQSLEGVRGGNYSVTITDANSCSATATTTVNEPDQLTSILSAGTIACNGGTTDITNTVSGGTEPFTFEWSNDATTQNLTGVGAGTYEVFVRDANGCVVSQHIDIEQPDALTTLLSAGTIACNGGTTDIINTVSGGTPDYQYFWTDDTHNQNNEGVSVGNYSVTVQDANGCSATASIEITQPNVLTSTLSAGTISCHGGTADVTNTVNGGTEPYQFAWSNEATTQSLEGVRGGTYSVTVTDANSCSATATTTVNEPDQLTSTLSAGTIDCNGGTTDITNSVSGGTEPITYEWSNEANTQNLTGVGAGTYEVFVRDANGCVVSQHIDIEQPDVLTASLTAGTVSCNGGTTNITSTVNGGTPNYTYAWSNGATTDELTGVGAGTYSVTVTDANTCTASAIVTITQPNALSVSISGPTSVCENTTSTLTANVQGGTADFTYLWSNSATTVSITTPQLAVATEYSVTVTDANDCSASASVNVEIGDTPGISISEVTPICVGGNKILQANVSNAGDDYTLEWSSTDTNAGLPADITTDAITVTPTTAGTYTYTVSLTATSCSDGQPFTSSDFVTLTVNSLPDAAITNSTNETTITCTTTEISLTATGGNTYAWSNGVAIADNNVTSAATYTVTVTDANECSNTASITISEDVAAPMVSITNNTGTTLLTCTTTTINVEATGDDASYRWSNEVTTATNAITTSGTYTVTATADNGCTSTTAIEITPNDDVPTVSITNNTGETELTCALTSISVTATGSGTSYQWSGGASTEEANNTFTAPGTYIVTATAGNGCSASDQITITRNIEAPDITASATANAICQGESTTISATGGQSYTWSPDTGLPTTVGSSITASPTSTITYTVTGVGENGCNGTAEVTVTVNQPNSSEFAATACDLYEWNGTTYDQTGDYTHTFTNANGCDSVVTLHLTINNSQTNIVDISACESYEWAGETYTETGEYNHTFTAANGCDSVVTLHLTINQPVAHEITETACEMFTWNGTDYNETGDYTGTFIAANGCDSIVTLHLTINNATTGVDTQVACNSYTWIDGNTYTESTDAPTFTLTNANGCDSVVTLHLTINYSTIGEFADQMCSGVPYTYEGQTFTEAGTYQVTLTNANGCDSIVTLTLTYANNCSGLVSGVITDENTGYAIPNAKVTIGNRVTRTNAEGQYSLSVIRGLKALRVSATGYISYSRTVDIQSDTTFDASLNAPQIHTDTDSILVSSYPYLEQSDSVTLSNNGNGTLVWSSITEYDNLELVEDSTIQRRNTRSLWDSIQTFATRENAEQAIATDGFFIYTASWMRPGEFNRYTPNGEYIETFYVENVGSIRNLSYDGTYFYGTEATNIIFKIDLDNQTLVDSIETDIPEIRHCSFNRQDGSLLAGSWNSLYRIDTASGTSQQIRDNLANVYSSAFDNLSSGGPYLWLFSQTSQNNGPSAYIRQFNISTGEYTNKTHYLDDINLTSSSLAGGICASEYVCEGKFVLLANVQNPTESNTIATYEIGRTNNVVKTGKKSGLIEPNGSESIPVKANVTATGDYSATIKYRAAVMGRQSNDINVSISAVAPECNTVQQISIVTDTFHTVTLDWQPVELGNYNAVSYLIYDGNSTFAIDTVNGTSITYNDLDVGEHCFHVRTLSVAEYQCLSESSDTVCAEIQAIPCNVSLTAETESNGESIFISWNNPVGVDHFSIRRNDQNNAEVLYTNEYVDSNVVPETDYCYTIIAYFENNVCNEITAIVCSRIASGVCSEAPELTATAMSNSVVLNWTGSSDALAYKVIRNDVKIGVTTDTSYFDNVAFGLEYCYRIERLCEYGMYVSSDDVCVFIEESNDENAVDEWSADKLSVYPNPTYGQFFIEGSQIATIQIYNASGQTVYETDNNDDERITVNCENWTPGLYNIRIVSVDGQMATRKVTIFR